MDELINKINEIAINEYVRLKKECKTYGELDIKITRYASDINWKNDFKNSEFYKLISCKMRDLYLDEINKKTID